MISFNQRGQEASVQLLMTFGSSPDGGPFLLKCKPETALRLRRPSAGARDPPQALRFQALRFDVTGVLALPSKIENPEIRPLHVPHGRRQRPTSGLVLRCNELQAFLELGIRLLDLVADFLPLETGERGMAEIIPGLPEPVFQRLHISFESVGHGALPSKGQRRQLM